MLMSTTVVLLVDNITYASIMLSQNIFFNALSEIEAEVTAGVEVRRVGSF